MDNNAAVQPAPPQAPIKAAPASKKMILWLILGLAVIVLAAGGIYLYLSRQQTANSLQTNATQTPTPVEENLENDLNTDLNTIDVEGLDQDFSSVDQDLKQL